MRLAYPDAFKENILLANFDRLYLVLQHLCTYDRFKDFWFIKKKIGSLIFIEGAEFEMHMLVLRKSFRIGVFKMPLIHFYPAISKETLSKRNENKGLGLET